MLEKMPRPSQQRSARGPARLRRWPRRRGRVEQINRSLLRSLFQDHTPGSSLLGLLLGLGIIVYILYTLKRGSLAQMWRRPYIDREHEPLAYWPSVILLLLVGSLVVVVYVMALEPWGKAL
jgi:hypothetical protein